MFRDNKNLTGSSVDVAYADGLEQLQILRKQVIVTNLYPSKVSVTEKMPKK